MQHASDQQLAQVQQPLVVEACCTQLCTEILDGKDRDFERGQSLKVVGREELLQISADLNQAISST